MEKVSVSRISAGDWAEEPRKENPWRRAFMEKRQKNQHALTVKEAAAKKLVGHWNLEIWRRIVCGDRPLEIVVEFADYSEKRIAVLERACLISIDAILGNRPEDPEAWSKEALEQRVEELKKQRAHEKQREKELLPGVIEEERRIVRGLGVPILTRERMEEFARWEAEGRPD